MSFELQPGMGVSAMKHNLVAEESSSRRRYVIPRFLSPKKALLELGFSANGREPDSVRFN